MNKRTMLGMMLGAAGLAFSLVACGGTSEEDAQTSSAEEDLTSSTTVGDWRLFGGGQCLVAVQEFYPKKFGVSVPIAGPGSDGACAAFGACKIWVDHHPDPNEWERIENDGHHMPTTYDLIVFPPISGDPFGHIASVDHVEGRNIFVMDSNYVAHEQKASHPHTVGWKAYGWYHLKKLGHSPAPSVSCVPGGYYCGGDKVHGSANDLYRCNAQGDGQTLAQACAHGCMVEQGRDDRCR